jgi:cytochrome c oxidase subunit 3
VTDLPAAHEPFAESAQQREADFLGMYIFLATEIMLFGGLLGAVFAYRVLHPQETAAAAQHLKLWLGAANTAVLLTSSLFMALAVEAARGAERRRAALWLLATAALGLTFLGIKGYEYLEEYREGLMPHLGPASPLRHPAERIFINLYFVGTGLHALHLAIGIAMTAGMAFLLRRGPLLPRRALAVEMVGLYWHLVDVIWVFVYPVLYLARG